ncbi:MAG: c-type cytochrome [Rhizobacter sp.]
MHYTLRSTFASATLLALAAAASPAWAQATGDVARGKQLFDDTAGASGISTFTSACSGCHNSVQNRRIAVGGSATAQIEPDAAYTAIVRAIGSVSQMTQFNALDADDVRDLAAYIADTAHVNKTALTFSSTGVNTASTAQTVTIKAPTLPVAALTIRNIAIAGTGVGNFTRTFTCDSKTFAAAESCTFTVNYDPRDATASNPVLTITMRDGASGTDYNRRVQLTGSIAGTTPTTPTPPSAPAEDSGGGAAGAGLLALLAAAGGVLGLRRRRA